MEIVMKKLVLLSLACAFGSGLSIEASYFKRGLRFTNSTHKKSTNTVHNKKLRQKHTPGVVNGKQITQFKNMQEALKFNQTVSSAFRNLEDKVVPISVDGIKSILSQSEEDEKSQEKKREYR